MEFLEFFNLKEDPFKLTPDSFYFYPSDNHNEILSSLNYVIEQKEGFFLATGEPGTGKTTTLKMFLKAWKDKALIALVLNPRLSPVKFFSTIMKDFKIEVKGTNKNDIMKAFRDFLIANKERDARVIIVVDEAQELPWETLEELRLLSNLETEKEKLLHIILMGQPQLQEMMASERLKQLNQRITVKCTFKPLNMDETSEYVKYRIIKSGKGKVLFQDGTNSFIYAVSKGIPRLINFVSSRAMMTAFLNDSKVVSKKHVVDAIRHLSEGNITAEKRLLKIWKYAALILIILSSLAATVFTKYYPTKSNLAPPYELKKYKLNKPEESIKEDGAGTDREVKQEKTEPVQEEIKPSEASKEETVFSVAAQENEVLERAKNAKVTVKAANVRAKPSINSKIVAWVTGSSQFKIIDEALDSEDTKWFKILLDDGRSGWVYGNLVLELE